MTVNRQSRPQSNASRLWVAAGSLWPPFCNQMFVEGSGSIDLASMQRAVNEASRVNPGSRLVLRGAPLNRRWIDSGCNPPVRTVSATSWSGYDLEKAPFIFDTLDIKSGPSCEVLIIDGNRPRIAFRTHHAVMDGRGTHTWAEDIFRVLRGEEPHGSEYTTIENDLLNLTEASEKPVYGRYLSPLGKPGEGEGFTWFRKKIDGEYTELLQAAMRITAEEAWKHAEGKVRIAIPVDLRSRKKGLRSTGNLTNAIFINIEKNTTRQDLGNEIKRRISEKNDGVLTWEDHVLKFIPVALLKKILSHERNLSLKNGLYRYSAVISNMGMFQLPVFTTKTFKAESVFFVPPGNELSPVFIGLAGTPGSLDIFLTAPGYYSSDGRVAAFLNTLTERIKSEAKRSNDR